MSGTAVYTAVKAAVAVMKDEKARTAVFSVVTGVFIAVMLPVFLLISLLALPTDELTGLMPEGEMDFLSGVRGQYGLDQYTGDADYLSGEGQDFSGLTFTNGQTAVHYYSQVDSRWKDIAYGDGTIGRSGCGPTALAMAVSSLTDTVIDPVQMSKWAFENGYKAYGNGSYLSLIPEGAAHFGLTVEYADKTQGQKVADALASGKLVIAIMSPGHFTKSGHFILLRGVTSDGMILVADPVSKSRSEQEWDMNIILEEARSTSGVSGPFWILS